MAGEFQVFEVTDLSDGGARSRVAFLCVLWSSLKDLHMNGLYQDPTLVTNGST